jgi:serine/threonine-protein kinase
MALPISQTGEREQRLDEAIAEYLETVDGGNRPDPKEWLARFPDLGPELERFFAGQDHVGGLLVSLGPQPSAERTVTGTDWPAREPSPSAGACLPYFGDYELLEEVARGGMGVVYRAQQKSLNRTVALKMILAGRLASAADVQRFHTEAEAAANLDHPHIVPIHEIGEHEGQHYFTMKFIEGGSLAQHGSRLRHDAPAIARLLATVARAVHHAHQRGLLHRDLKPANILLDLQGQPHLTDFGLARRLTGDPGLTRTGTAVGTPSYMAPEQAAGPRMATTTAADVYSLGAILYELLTGVPPFRAEHPLETLRQVLEREPVRPRSIDATVDRDLETICLKCLEKDPHRRYASAAELADDLERLLRNEPVRARRIGALERLRRWCRRRPVIAGLSAALALSLVVGTVVVVWEWRAAEAHSRRAEWERDRAATERGRAEEAFRQAHEAVNDFCIKVSDGPMRDAAGLQPVRRELLQSALAYYDRFLHERGQDPALRREMADTHYRIATITSMLGPKAQAVEAYHRALEVYQDLLSSEPTSVSLRTSLAETHARLGMLQYETGRPTAALASYREAVRRYEELLSEQPGNDPLQNGTAAVYSHLGELHRWAGRVPAAFECMSRAQDLQQELVERHPRVAEYRANLARMLCRRANIEAARGHHDDARAIYAKASAMQERLIDQEPVNLWFQQDLATTYRQLGGGLCVKHEYDEALIALERSQGLLQRLVRVEPGIAGLHRDLAAGHRQFGHAYRDTGKLADALEQYEKGRAVMEELVRAHPEVPDFRNDLAKCHFDRATILDRREQFEESIATLKVAADLRRALVDAYPDHVGYQSDLGLTLGNLALGLCGLERFEEALLVAREALPHHLAAFNGSPEVRRYRGYLGGAHGLVGRFAADTQRYDEAYAAIVQREKLWPDNGKELMFVVEDFARLAKAVPAPDTRAADRAIAVLQQAVAAGFRDDARLREDKAFAVLRGRADFQQILAELAAKSAP